MTVSPPEGSLAARADVRDDPFTIAVLEDALTAIGDEMFVTTQRTSQTPLVYEVLDFCVGVTDAVGNLVSQGNGVTLFLATLTSAARSVLEKFPSSTYQSGDVFITNDPYGGGGTHPSDMTLVMPVLWDDRLVGFTLNKAHWIDVGGKDPGTVSTDTTDIYQEGLQLPCVRLFAGGAVNEALIDVIRANVRFPDLAIGDLFAQVAAVRVGAARLERLCEKYGVDLVHRAMRQRFERASTLARQELAKLPAGTYEASDLVESPTGPLPITVRVTVTSERLLCDFTGTHGELGFSQNLSRTGLDSAARLVFKAITDPETPLSDGSFEALEIVCPPRTMFTAERPAPISAYWETLSRASDLIWKALAPVIPHRLTAGHFLSVSAEVIVGTHHETGEPFILFEPNAGGWGAGLGIDGERGLVGLGDGETYILPVEVAEHQYALHVEQYAYNVAGGGAGAGKWRGGAGIVKDYRLLCDEATVSGFVGRHEYPPWGVAGGREGSINAIHLIRGKEAEPWVGGMFSREPIALGDVVRIITGTGGGWGDPLERDPALVAWDVREEFVSLQEAEEVYGVLVDSETFEVAGVTAARRERAR